jgi:hypothetical protein
VEDPSVLRKLGLAISYSAAFVYILSIVLPAVYCFQRGCRGPGELDAFMPAFLLTPPGAIATAFSLNNAIQHIRKRERLALFWSLAIIFVVVLLGVIALVAWIVLETVFPR